MTEHVIDIENGIDTESEFEVYFSEFVQDICETNFYMNLKDILNEDELNIIAPRYYDEGEEEFFNPLLLSNALKKIYAYLLNNKDIIPMCHEIYLPNTYFKKPDWVDSYEFIDNNKKYYLNGHISTFTSLFSHYSKFFPELLDKDYYIKYQKYFNIIVDFPIPLELIRIKAEPIIKVGSREFQTRSLYKYQQYEPQINDILKICQKASSLNKGIVWRIF